MPDSNKIGVEKGVDFNSLDVPLDSLKMQTLVTNSQVEELGPEVPVHLPWMIVGAVVTTIFVAIVSNIFQARRFNSQLKKDLERHRDESSNQRDQLDKQLIHNHEVNRENNDSELVRQKNLFEHDRLLEKEKIIREKMEYLIITFNTWSTNRESYKSLHQLFLLDMISKDERIKDGEVMLKDESINSNKIIMLLDIYFLKHRSLFDAYLLADQEADTIINAIVLGDLKEDVVVQVNALRDHIKKMYALRRKFIASITSTENDGDSSRV